MNLKIRGYSVIFRKFKRFQGPICESRGLIAKLRKFFFQIWILESFSTATWASPRHRRAGPGPRGRQRGAGGAWSASALADKWGQPGAKVARALTEGERGAVLCQKTTAGGRGWRRRGRADPRQPRRAEARPCTGEGREARRSSPWGAEEEGAARGTAETTLRRRFRQRR